MHRGNLLKLSEDVEIVSENNYDNDEEIIDNNYDPDADYSTAPQKGTQYHKHKCKTYFCDRCLNGFTKEDLLIKHKEDCYGINKTSTRIEMPTKGRSHITFKNHKNQTPVSYVIYADFESIIKPKTAKARE